ncbi:MAG: hypothetical protein EOM52_07885, partial [Clostridia bacterium]|nr:hypothetical protein [Clostridia bacterium]
MDLTQLFTVALGAILVNNFIFAQFLGICPFMGVSKKTDTALGMGLAVTFVMGIASAVTWLVNTYLLVNPAIFPDASKNLGFMQTVVYILVIASLVQFVEMFLQKAVPSLYQALGIYLPLITTNCAVLGVALQNTQNNYDFITSVVYGVTGGLGFLLAIWCALFPMGWYVFLSALMWHCKSATDKERQLPGAGLLLLRQPALVALLAVLSACAWVSCEWLRSWLLTGIPWNELGISQYRRIGVIQLAEFTGVHGLSFLIVLINGVLAGEGAYVIRHWLGAAEKRGMPWHLVMAMALTLPLCWLGTRPEALPDADTPSIRV